MNISLEKQVTISVNWTNRFINEMIDTLSKQTNTSLYITKDDSRQIAMKSMIGLLSGDFKKGETVKLTSIGDNESSVEHDLHLAEKLLLGDE